MKPNSYLQVRPRQKAISVSLLVAAALVGALAWFVVSAHADSAPDWLRAAAKEKLPDYPKDTVAVMLLDDGQFTVKDNGDTERVSRRAYKLLRPEAREDYGFAAVRFDNQTKVSSFKAWTITPDGHEIELKEKDAIETSLTTYEIFSDERAKVLKFAEANPGSVVGYEVVQRQRPEVLDDDWYFQETVPVHRSRLPSNSHRVGSSAFSGQTIPNRSLRFPAISTFGRWWIARPSSSSPRCRRGTPLRLIST